MTEAPSASVLTSTPDKFSIKLSYNTAVHCGMEQMKPWAHICLLAWCFWKGLMWNSQKITDPTGKITFIKCPIQKSHSKFSVTNQKTNIFGKTLQILVQDSNRPQHLRYGRLLLLMMTFIFHFGQDMLICNIISSHMLSVNIVMTQTKAL